ncbi:hypothetical protein R6Q59_011928 [Mikania micrantha]
MRPLYVCDEEEKELHRQEPPGVCPRLGGKAEAVDCSHKWRLCFVPVCNIVGVLVLLANLVVLLQPHHLRSTACGDSYDGDTGRCRAPMGFCGVAKLPASDRQVDAIRNLLMDRFWCHIDYLCYLGVLHARILCGLICSHHRRVLGHTHHLPHATNNREASGVVRPWRRRLEHRFRQS